MYRPFIVETFSPFYVAFVWFGLTLILHQLVQTQNTHDTHMWFLVDIERRRLDFARTHSLALSFPFSVLWRITYGWYARYTNSRYTREQVEYYTHSAGRQYKLGQSHFVYVFVVVSILTGVHLRQAPNTKKKHGDETCEVTPNHSLASQL